MEIKLKTGNNINNISITISYAPHRGYPNIELGKYWEGINSLFGNIKDKKHLSSGALTIMDKSNKIILIKNI